MLFKKKDQNESVKAKTELFATKAKKSDAKEKDELRKSAHVDGAKSDAGEGKTLKTTVAAGKTNANILKNPRITEKATMEAGKNVYTFDVAITANKIQIKEAIKDVYRVTPIAVRIASIPARTFTTRRGTKSAVGRTKKAYVYLKKGDSIELV